MKFSCCKFQVVCVLIKNSEFSFPLTVLVPSLAFCGGAEGSLLKYWFHFSVFIVLLALIIKSKFIPLVRNWEKLEQKTIDENTKILNDAIKKKELIEDKLFHSDAEVDSIIKEAHQVGKARKETILNQLKDELALLDTYKRRLAEEFESLKRQTVKEKLLSISKDKSRQALSKIPLEQQVQFFEILVSRIKL
ncbi:MAG: hypothetical protein NZO16_02005 [Deltaproteobacteria bacterium]|nr:hypothetical protein [Deltaproteobacteria bacterium]